MKIQQIIIILLFSPIIAFAQSVKPVVLIIGKVLNERNMQPVAARVIYEILPNGVEAGIARSNPGNGDYKIILPYGKTYGYMALAEGYYSVTQNLDVTNLTAYKEIDEQNLFLAPIEVDQVVRLNNVFFEGESSKLLSASYPELNRFVQFLKVNKKIEIEISGHVDNSFSSIDKEKISLERANSVLSYILTQGISEKRIITKGYGDSTPIGFNNTAEGRDMNRRIEFKVISLTKTKK